MEMWGQSDPLQFAFVIMFAARPRNTERNEAKGFSPIQSLLGRLMQTQLPSLPGPVGVHAAHVHIPQPRVEVSEILAFLTP